MMVMAESSVSFKSFDSQRFRHLDRLLAGCLDSDGVERSKFADHMVATNCRPDLRSPVVGDEEASARAITNEDDDQTSEGYGEEEQTVVKEMAGALRGTKRHTLKELSSLAQRSGYNDSRSRQATTHSVLSREKDDAVLMKASGSGECSLTPTLSKSFTTGPVADSSSSSSSSTLRVDEDLVYKRELLSSPLIQLGHLMHCQDERRLFETHARHPRVADEDDQSLSCGSSDNPSSGSDSMVAKMGRCLSTASNSITMGEVENETQAAPRSTTWTLMWMLLLLLFLFPELLGFSTNRSKGVQLLLPSATSSRDYRLVALENHVESIGTSPTMGAFAPQKIKVEIDDKGALLSARGENTNIFDVNGLPDIHTASKTTADSGRQDIHVTSLSSRSAVVEAVEKPSILERWIHRRHERQLLPCESLRCRIFRGLSGWRRKVKAPSQKVWHRKYLS